MSELLFLLLALIAAFTIGANNASACVGAIVGAGLMKDREALVLAGLGMMLGTIGEGWKMKPSIGYLLGPSAQQQQVLFALMLSSLIVLAVVTLFAIPLSFSQALVGGAIGIGLLTGTLDVRFATVVSLSWVYAPLLSIPAAAGIYLLLRRLLPKRLFLRARINAVAVLVSSFYVSYVLGANTIGILDGVTALPTWTAGLALGTAAFLGSALGGRLVTRTVSQNLVGISPVASSGASFGSALLVEVMTQLAIPVSVSQMGVAAILGPALTRRVRVSNGKEMAKVVLTWAIAPAMGLLLATAMYRLGL